MCPTAAALNFEALASKQSDLIDGLALSLFVFWILADYSDTTFSFDDLAFLADRFNSIASSLKKCKPFFNFFPDFSVFRRLCIQRSFLVHSRHFHIYFFFPHSIPKPVPAGSPPFEVLSSSSLHIYLKPAPAGYFPPSATLCGRLG